MAPLRHQHAVRQQIARAHGHPQHWAVPRDHQSRDLFEPFVWQCLRHQNEFIDEVVETTLNQIARLANDRDAGQQRLT